MHSHFLHFCLIGKKGKEALELDKLMSILSGE